MRRKDEELEYDGEEDEMAEVLGDETAVLSEPGMFSACNNYNSKWVPSSSLKALTPIRCLPLVEMP